MKSIIKYYLVPVFLLIILNLILLFYVNQFQRSTHTQLINLDSSNQYLSTVLNTPLALNNYLKSSSIEDSIYFRHKVDKLITDTNIFTSTTQMQPGLRDSLIIAINDYSLVLKNLASSFYEFPTYTDEQNVNYMVESHSLLQKIQHLVHLIDEENSHATVAALNRSDKFLYILIGVYFVIIVCVLLVSYYNIILPLKRLRNEIRKLSLGSYSQIEVEREDEIGDLIDSFNETSRSLELSQKELQLTNEKLQQTNKELESFAYSVSHDLRSPLRSISGFSEALVSGFSDEISPRAQDYLNRVNRAAQKMGELIDDILKLSRITRSDVKRSKVNVSALAREVIDLIKTENESNHIFKVEEDMTVFADRGLTKVILLNLISNAIKFSKESDPPNIKVGSMRVNDTLFIYVEDNGIGFDMKYHEKIFTAFQRLHSKDDFEGSGIGLATVKRIVHKHGGSIFAESKQGEGTTIKFNLGP